MVIRAEFCQGYYGAASDQVLAFSNLSLGTNHPSVGGFLNSSHVDRRDGFPRGLLLADALK